MTDTPAPDAAVQIAEDAIEYKYDVMAARVVCDALARAGWLHDPTRIAQRTADHDAVVAERDAALERIAELEVGGDELGRLIAVRLILRQWANGMDPEFARAQIDIAVNSGPR